MNQTIEAYLHSYINQEMKDWVELLPMAEYAYNNTVTLATGLTPFYANYGWHPETMNPRKTQALNPESSTYTHRMQTTIATNRTALEATQERMAKYANTKRKEPRPYQVGDLIMLSCRILRTKRPAKKLDHKYHRPFQIERIISPPAVRLTLPQKWKTHPTYH